MGRLELDEERVGVPYKEGKWDSDGRTGFFCGAVAARSRLLEGRSILVYLCVLYFEDFLLRGDGVTHFVKGVERYRSGAPGTSNEGGEGRRQAEMREVRECEKKQHVWYMCVQRGIR